MGMIYSYPFIMQPLKLFVYVNGLRKYNVIRNGRKTGNKIIQNCISTKLKNTKEKD